jgi:hypothetical protein
MLKIERINPIEYPGWDDSLLSMDRSTFFHSSAWTRVLSESYGYLPIYFIIRKNGIITGLMPVMEVKSFLTGKRGVSLPFTDICEPVAENQEEFDALLSEATKYGRRAGWKHIEIRGGSDFLSNEPVAAEHVVHSLKLSADDTVVSRNFKPSVNRNIRKAEKGGVTIALEHSLGSVSAYYQLHCRTRRYHGLPPQPWPFFRKIHQHVIAPGKGFVALSSYQDRWVAGAIFAIYRDQAMYKYGASDRRFQYLRPNNLILDEAIRWCCRNEIRKFSFGRTELNNEGLAQFKRGWGADEGRVQYYKFDLRSNRFVGEEKGMKASYTAFKALPLPVLRLAGNLLYRHAG